MDANKILNLYAAGERTFYRANLHQINLCAYHQQDKLSSRRW